jgi:hypothetical protein
VAETVKIERRFRGPPESGQGGYSCGILARFVDGPAKEVTLRMPPPLERELEVVEGEEGPELRDGEALVAEARTIEDVGLELPAPVTLEQARAAREGSPLHVEHPFPMCVCCGPQRQPGDGLRVISGPVEGRDDVVSSPWEIDASVPLEDGRVAEEIVWTVLDCPTGNATLIVPDPPEMMMLGRLSAELLAPVEPGNDYVAIGWPIFHEERKFCGGSAILDTDGEPVAIAKGLWIKPKP